MRFQAVLFTVLSVVLPLATGCDKANPVAPSGSTITLSASPAQIPGARGTSTITAVVLRANGQPVNPGTEVRFSTTLGTIDQVAETNSSGVAEATLRGDGRTGTAKIKATAGNIGTAPEIDVVIGSVAGSLTLQATPSSIPEGGGTVQLLALVRDDRGQPLPGASVNFSAPVGTLNSGGNFRTTDQDGRATDRLTLSSAEISTLTSDTFEVRAEVAGGTGTLMNDTSTISIQRPPIAQFSFQLDATSRTVAFQDQSQPRPSAWLWEFGDGQTSTEQNPVHTYPTTQNTFIVRLTVRNAVGESSVSKTVTFPSTTADASRARR